ncbi:MAG: nucleotide exchange factor GrpE, partial [Muribaculaceae bacterium]|nr:nucleotide exchange factor GrpE [Muribaculaceae bacterium]
KEMLSGESDEELRLMAREQLEEAQAQVEKEKKEYLFLMAEFDNYRKRVTKEKAEIIKNGAEKVLAGLLPIVDDFERGLKATKDADNADALREGMELIYNKLIKYLESNGVKAMDSTGKDFDPEFHEAIASIPAPSEDLKGKVIDTTQTGYTLNDKVLRHAKVAVGE